MLKRQLYLIYILSLFLPISIVGTFLLYNNYTTLMDHHQDMLISDNLRVRSIMFEVTTSLTNVCDIIAESSEVYELIGKDYESIEEARAKLYDFDILSNIYKRYTEISSIALYTDNPHIESYDFVYSVNEDNAKWFDQHVQTPGYFWITLNEINKMGVPYEELQLIHHINIPNSDYEGLLVMTISNNYLKNRIDNNVLNVDIAVNQDAVFYSTWGNANKTIQFNDYADEPFFNYSGVDTFMGEKTFLEVSTVKPFKSEDSIYVFSSDTTALDRVYRIEMIAMLIVVMSLVMPSIVIVIYTRQLTNRVDTLRSEMHRVTAGDYNIMEKFKGNDELVDLFEDLHTMIHSIKERDQVIFDGKMKEQQLINHQNEMELALLSSKINPHFLYNTLETIRMKAFNSKNLEVANAVKLLGRYMRYNLESTGEVTTLKSELDYIRIYLGIQQLRFANRIDYAIEVHKDINIEDIPILPLLIQPLVENALLHGHEETTENGMIWIRCKDKGQGIVIEIEDNGCGITDERLKLIMDLNQEKQNGQGSFGLFNIMQRLLLYYGESSHFTIDSTLGIGTCISFEIPKHKQVERSNNA